MRDFRKGHPLCLLMAVITSACTITIQTNPPDAEATQRHIVKSTLQAIKDRGATQIAEGQNPESPDEPQPPNGAQPSDPSVPSQSTQVPASAPPPDISDLLLPTTEVRIFESATPIVPPNFSADQGKLAVIPSRTPTRTPQPFAGGSLISFDVYEGCGRYLTLQYHVRNQSTVPLESAYVDCHNTGNNDFHSASTNRPFHSSAGECAPGDERIKAGTDSHVVVYMGNERMNSGEDFYCTVSVCAVDLPANLSGVPCVVLDSPIFTAP